MWPVAATQTGILRNIVAVADIVDGLASISPFVIAGLLTTFDMLPHQIRSTRTQTRRQNGLYLY